MLVDIAFIIVSCTRKKKENVYYNLGIFVSSPTISLQGFNGKHTYDPKIITNMIFGPSRFVIYIFIYKILDHSSTLYG